MATDGKDDIELISEEIEQQGGGGAPGAEGAAEDEEKIQLRRDLAAARATADDNARRLQDERNARKRTDNDLTDTRLMAVDNALSDTDQRLTDAKKRKAEAYTAGDYTAAADIDVEVAELVGKKRDLARGKENIQAQIEERKSRPVIDDPVEAYVSNMSSESQRWIRAHPEVVTDAVKNAELTLAHQRTLREGVKVDTPEYYRAMTEKMGYGDTGMNGDNGSLGNEADDEPEERRAPPAAPPSRGTVSSVTGQQERGSTRRLSPDQRATARDLGMTDAEYGKELERLQKEGRLSGQIYH